AAFSASAPVRSRQLFHKVRPEIRTAITPSTSARVIQRRRTAAASLSAGVGGIGDSGSGIFVFPIVAPDRAAIFLERDRVEPMLFLEHPRGKAGLVVARQD